MGEQQARLTTMTQTWDKAALEEKMIVVVGDWNIDMLAWTPPKHIWTQHLY